MKSLAYTVRGLWSVRIFASRVGLGSDGAKSYLLFTFLGAAYLSSYFLVLAVAAFQPNGVLSGVVTDPGGHPISNAAVILHSSTTVRIAKSMSDGRFALASLPEGRYIADVMANGFVNQHIEPITIPDEEARPMTITLKVASVLYECGRDLMFYTYTEVSSEQGRELAGEVRHDGSPVAGAKVLLFQPGHSYVVASHETDKEGNFQFADLAPGKYVLQVAHKPFETYKSQPVWVAPETLTKVKVGMNWRMKRKGGVVICQ